MTTTSDQPPARTDCPVKAVGTFDAALDCLNEAEEVELYELYEQVALARHHASRDAIQETGGENVDIHEDGAWVAIRVWIPKTALGLN